MSDQDAVVEFLDLDDVVWLARRLLGEPPPIRDVGLLGSAVARPQTTVGGRDAYPVAHRPADTTRGPEGTRAPRLTEISTQPEAQGPPSRRRR